MLWRFASGAPAIGIFVGEEHAWVGNEKGDVYALTHEGRITGRFGLPDGVKCIVADDFRIYAGCDDGRVYDLSGKIPHVAYEIAGDADIYWLDIADGVLGVSDRQGGITTVDHEDEFQWSRRSSGDGAWMVRCSDEGVFHRQAGSGCMWSRRALTRTAGCRSPKTYGCLAVAIWRRRSGPPSTAVSTAREARSGGWCSSRTISLEHRAPALTRTARADERAVRLLRRR